MRGLNRMSHLRKDAEWLKRALPRGQFWALTGSRFLLGPDNTGLGFDEVGDTEEEPVFLGCDAEDVAHFGVRVKENGSEPASGRRLVTLRAILDEVDSDTLGILMMAQGLLNWRSNCRFCSRCGGAVMVGMAGHVATCSGCGLPTFPRTDPAVITLVSHGDKALLARNAAWAPGRYSTLAGFVEPGEELEEAVRREVREEVGVTVDEKMRYFASQAWPFPASLMVGFLCTADSRVEPRVCLEELEDAHWFTRAQIRAGVVTLPPKAAISHRLISHWLNHD
jgi:NAD+ diphosphatase